MQSAKVLLLAALLGAACTLTFAQNDNDLMTLTATVTPTNGPLQDDNEQITPEGAGKVRVVGNTPVFLLFNTDGEGNALNTATPEWFQVTMPRVYEANANGNLVTGRGNLNVLDQAVGTQTNWTMINTMIGNPSVRAVQASLVYKQKATFPACPGAANQAAITNANANAKFTLTIYLFQADTNVTFNGVTTECLKGNLKFNVDANHWPFCSTSNSLVVDFATYTSDFTALTPVVESGDDKVAQALAIFDQAETKLGNIPAPDAGTAKAGPGSPNGRFNGTGTPTRAQIRTILGRITNGAAATYITDRLFYSFPVVGLGRRSSTAAKYVAVSASNVTVVTLDVPTTAFIDGTATNFTVDVTKPANMQYELLHLVFPHFTNTLSFDPTMTFGATPSAITLAITDALANSHPAPPPPPLAQSPPAPTSSGNKAVVSLAGTAAAVLAAWALLW